ncbi:MAG: S8 family peptidase [Draconibacterium sp.]
MMTILSKYTFMIIIVFVCSIVKAQDVSIYIQIEDNEIVPHLTKSKNSDCLEIKAKDPSLNELYKRFNIKKFGKAFPTAVTPRLQNTYLIICNDKKLGEEIKKRYKEKIPRVEVAEETPMLTYDPNDYGLALGQPNLDLINAKTAWDIVLGLPKVDIAISDTYFDLNHEDLNMTLFSGSNNSNVSVMYHGTFVAGLTGAITNNSKGLSSVGFDTHLAVTSNYANHNEVLLLAQAGYRVINCSWETHCSPISSIEDVYNEIRNVWDAVVVFGAGNSGARNCGNNNPAYPGSYDANIAVTSVGHINDYGTPGTPANNWKDVHEEVIGDSLKAHKHHSTIDICAPGYNVSSTDVMGALGLSATNYANSWGTSFAAPQVSATLGLIFSVNPCLSADGAVDILLNNADNSIYSIPENTQYIGRIGAGRLDVNASVEAAAESATTYLQNLTLTGTQVIQDNYAIRVMSDVAVAQGASIGFITRKEVTIEKGFEVGMGAELTINVDVHNSINCN